MTSAKSEDYQCKNCSHTHKVRACLAYGKTCKICKQPNHFASCCPNKVTKTQGRPRQNKKVNEVGLTNVNTFDGYESLDIDSQNELDLRESCLYVDHN